MALTVEPGVTFIATLLEAETGLVGSIGIRIDRDGVPITDRQTGGIVEEPSGSGTYHATLTAPFELGDYLLVWDDNDAPPNFATEVLTVAGLGAAGFAVPTVEKIAVLLRSRTTDENGTEVGTFTDDGRTRPSAAQVRLLAAQAAGDVAARIGFQDLTGGLPQLATNVSAVRTAMLIELSFFPEQIESGQSPYEQFRDLYAEQLGFLAAAVDGDTSGAVNRMTQVRVRSIVSVPYYPVDPIV